MKITPAMLLPLVLACAGGCGGVQTVTLFEPADGAGTGSVGVYSTKEEVAFSSDELPQGSIPIRGGEAVGFVGGGLAAGLGVLAGCAPTVMFYGLCVATAATLGLAGAAAGGVAGDFLSDQRDHSIVSTAAGSAQGLQARLRRGIVAELADLGRDPVDLGQTVGKPVGDKQIYLDVDVTHVGVQGVDQDTFAITMRVAAKLTDAADGRVISERKHDYVGPALPAGVDETATVAVMEQGIDSGIRELALQIARQDLGQHD